jgi:hypothetical protein
MQDVLSNSMVNEKSLYQFTRRHRTFSPSLLDSIDLLERTLCELYQRSRLVLPPIAESAVNGAVSKSPTFYQQFLNDQLKIHSVTRHGDGLNMSC